MTLNIPNRVQLAHLPTPIERLDRLSKHLGGPDIYVKRDDLTGFRVEDDDPAGVSRPEAPLRVLSQQGQVTPRGRLFGDRAGGHDLQQPPPPGA